MTVRTTSVIDLGAPIKIFMGPAVGRGEFYALCRRNGQRVNELCGGGGVERVENANVRLATNYGGMHTFIRKGTCWKNGEGLTNDT